MGQKGYGERRREAWEPTPGNRTARRTALNEEAGTNYTGNNRPLPENSPINARVCRRQPCVTANRRRVIQERQASVAPGWNAIVVHQKKYGNPNPRSCTPVA